MNYTLKNNGNKHSAITFNPEQVKEAVNYWTKERMEQAIPEVNEVLPESEEKECVEKLFPQQLFRWQIQKNLRLMRVANCSIQRMEQDMLQVQNFVEINKLFLRQRIVFITEEKQNGQKILYSNGAIAMEQLTRWLEFSR